jgi:crossover junction endodeoxyribonuclease RuvC
VQNCIFLLLMEVILGIDPGSHHMGYALLECRGAQLRTLDAGVLSLNKKTAHFERLAEIFRMVETLINKFKPSVMAIEAPFYGKSVQSMLKLGRAQGTAIAAAIRCGIPVCEYAPRLIKQAVTGRGAASKEQVQAMLRQMHLLPDDEKRMDASDALAVAFCHATRRESGGRLPLPSQTLTGKRRRSRSGAWAHFLRQNPDRLSE